MKGQGGVLYLLLASEKLPMPLTSLHPAAAKGQGKQGALSGHPALDLHSASTQRRLETNPDAHFLFSRYCAKLCWPLTSGIPSCGGMVLPRGSTLLFLHK